jgi:hypothetical protein
MADLGTAKWNQLSELTFTALEGQLCATGLRRNQYDVGLKNFDVHAGQEAFRYFTELGTKFPDTKLSSLVYEVYPLQAFQAVPADSTAYAHREVNIITSVALKHYAN